MGNDYGELIILGDLRIVDRAGTNLGTLRLVIEHRIAREHLA
jgi:hypothetical protein